ncbi:MAG: ABC transporter ATP-binding protein [Candidatus Lambdaproteobacteria bacterium]|nr:ABC transporter ATP-binding protein [Candidatus Lambdaproteobacteria bacterium]
MIVELERVSRGYADGQREILALAGIDLRVPAGQTVALLGKSGSGKSTLLHLIGGLEHPSGGRIRVRGQALHEMNDAQLTTFRLRHVGFVFQFFHLLPTLSVYENLLLPAELAGLPHREGQARASALLAGVGLAQRGHAMPDRLSGGEQQRVAIARGLMLEPELVLADEPTGNLDSDTGRQVLELLLELTRVKGTTLIIATHSGDLAARLQRRVELRDGRIVADSDGAAAGSAHAEGRA